MMLKASMLQVIPLTTTVWISKGSTYKPANNECWGTAFVFYSMVVICRLTGLKIERKTVHTFFMRHLLFNLRHRAETIFQSNLATRDRPLGFQIAVATLFAIDVLAFIAFCIIKIVSA